LLEKEKELLKEEVNATKESQTGKKKYHFITIDS
jgi:hypothetical protein